MSRGAPGSDRGSVLLLFPAAVLVVFLLGSIAIDSAMLHLRHREVHNLAFDAANDAAGAGLDLEAVRAGIDAYDVAAVAAVAQATVSAADAGVEIVAVRTEGDTVAVTLRTSVAPLLGRPFGLGDRTIEVTARATGVRNPT